MPLLWVFEFIIGVHTHTQNEPLPHIGLKDRVVTVSESIRYAVIAPRSATTLRSLDLLSSVWMCVYRLNLTEEHNKLGRADSLTREAPNDVVHTWLSATLFP